MGLVGSATAAGAAGLRLDAVRAVNLSRAEVRMGRNSVSSISVRASKTSLGWMVFLPARRAFSLALCGFCCQCLLVLFCVEGWEERTRLLIYSQTPLSSLRAPVGHPFEPLSLQESRIWRDGL